MIDELFGSSEAGKKGGEARAKKLNKQQRSEIAKKAAAARWAGSGDRNIPLATHGSPDKPLRIGDVEIPCYVLEDGRRVIVQAGMITALGMSRGGSSHKGGDRLAKFVGQDRIKPFCKEGLVAGTQMPVKFITKSGTMAMGFEATLLADICDAVLEARKADRLTGRQVHIADQCEILMRSFARVGIIALVDEATGYQADRAQDALARILEQFIAKELQPWVRTFEPDFYQELFRLRGIDFDGESLKKPRYIGHLTNNLIYKRIAPGVLEELRNVNPTNEKGRRKSKHHQRLTRDVGHPKLTEHIGKVTTLMRAFDTWDEFQNRLDRALPKHKSAPLFEQKKIKD